MKEISAIAVVTLRAIGAAYRHLQLSRHLFLRTNEGRPPMSRLRSLKALLIISSVTAAGRQQNEPSLPRFSDLEATVVRAVAPYQPEQSVSGVLRVWGHGSLKIPWLKQLVTFWEEGFERYHPAFRIQYEMHGTSSAIPALYTGVGDLAILGEEIDPAAVSAFERVRHYAPLRIDVMTGSLEVRNFDYAQMFFVHSENPISRLTLQQLDAIFGEEHRRGPRNIRTWGQLGLTGEWEDKPITPYGWRIDDSFGIFLETTLLYGSHRWNCALKEYAHISRPDGSIYDHGQQILDALSKDRYGIAVSNIRYAGPHVKAIALGSTEAGPYYQASKETLIDRKYPLTRIIPAVIDRPPGMPVEPLVKEFLRYILSRDGQDAIVRDGRYLP
ncbi:MAG: substrate-binding domain-containing protein, partial [Acidobacteriaceae bacterium]|nr:substrate-binding domain-containing protein [Acidobacteriaceae bacterium]